MIYLGMVLSLKYKPKGEKKVYGHSPIYDWQDMDTPSLEKAIELLNQLEELGIQGCSDEMYDTMKAELKDRKQFEVKLRDALGEWHEGREVTDQLLTEFYWEWKRTGLDLDKWINSCEAE